MTPIRYWVLKPLQHLFFSYVILYICFSVLRIHAGPCLRVFPSTISSSSKVSLQPLVSDTLPRSSHGSAVSHHLNFSKRSPSLKAFFDITSRIALLSPTQSFYTPLPCFYTPLHLLPLEVMSIVLFVHYSLSHPLKCKLCLVHSCIPKGENSPITS